MSSSSSHPIASVHSDQVQIKCHLLWVKTLKHTVQSDHRTGRCLLKCQKLKCWRWRLWNHVDRSCDSDFIHLLKIIWADKDTWSVDVMLYLSWFVFVGLKQFSSCVRRSWINRFLIKPSAVWTSWCFHVQRDLQIPESFFITSY